MNSSRATLDVVKSLIAKTLGIEDRVNTLGPSTPLLGAIPELDSFAVLELATALEQQFGFEIDGSEFTGEIFETVGSLAEFVESKTGCVQAMANSCNARS